MLDELELLVLEDELALDEELELDELDEELELLGPDTVRTTIPVKVPLSVVLVTTMVRLVSLTVVLNAGGV